MLPTQASGPMMLSSVLLPEPDGPFSATNPAGRNAMEMPSSTSVPTSVPALSLRQMGWAGLGTWYLKRVARG